MSSVAQTHGLQLKSEGGLVDLLQESIAQLVIDIVERLDNLSGQILMLQTHNLIRENPRHPWSISFRAYPCESVKSASSVVYSLSSLRQCFVHSLG